MEKLYTSTRNSAVKINEKEAILKGLSDEGGLFVPTFLDDITLDVETLLGKNYGEIAEVVLRTFLPTFSEVAIQSCIKKAYYSGKFSEAEPVSLSYINDDTFLELYHGPTSAFKDMALTILPHFMQIAKEEKNTKETVILTATSGDTGKAALEGFANVEGTKIIVFYPKNGVSAVQEQQMRTQVGDNVLVVGIDGNFDDAQTGVKKLLSNQALKAKLESSNMQFSSANSINIGRLLPQIVYYVYTYVKMREDEKIVCGERINFAVPTGNFGNILAGYYAKKIGVPIHKLICASNENSVLTDAFKCKNYNRNRAFYKTTSPSMDILVSSNFERLLYELHAKQSAAVLCDMQALDSVGAYPIISSDITDNFASGFATQAEVNSEIFNLYNRYNYLCDPHTAVAFSVYKQYQSTTDDRHKTVIVSTASPFKFTKTVYEALYKAKDMDEFQMVTALSEKTQWAVPVPLVDLDKREITQHTQCAVHEMADQVEKFLNL